jgi:hypothetical protein
MIKAITSIVQKSVFKTIEFKATEIFQSELDKINHHFGEHHHHQFTFLNLAALNRSGNFVY